jgi:hypothetical protein
LRKKIERLLIVEKKVPLKSKYIMDIEQGG